MIRYLWLVAVAAVLFVAPVHAAEFTAAQRAEIVQIMRDALKQDPTILRDAVEALQSDDGDKRQAATRSAIAAARLVAPNDPVAGNPNGDVTIVEFFDARCPYCKKLEPTMDSLLKQDRSVRLVYKDMPILGPPSMIASKALLAAQRQGAYEKLRTALMAGPPDISKATVQAAAKGLGLDWPKLERDMEDASVQTRLDANLKLAHTIGIEGTPALVIGGELIPGAVGLDELQAAVKTARGK